jgi:hypothetical protein
MKVDSGDILKAECTNIECAIKDISIQVDVSGLYLFGTIIG